MAKSTRTPSTQIGPGVLSAAVEILDVEGPDGFTVRDVAERAGVAPMAIYNHFNGISGVIEALWVRGFETLSEAINVATSDPVADFMSMGAAYRAFALENPGLYTVMFLHRFRGFEPSVDTIHVAARGYLTLVELVERCQRSGLFPGTSASNAAQVVWSACHGFVSLELMGMNFGGDREVTYRVLLETLRDGFR